MSKVQVLNNTKGIIELAMGCNLMPGSNFVEKKVMDDLANHKTVMNWAKHGVIAIKELELNSSSNSDGGDGDGSEYVLKSLNVNDSKGVIEQTFSFDELIKWQESEKQLAKPRKGVLDAIEKQLAEIDNQTKKDAQDDNDDNQE